MYQARRPSIGGKTTANAIPPTRRSGGVAQATFLPAKRPPHTKHSAPQSLSSLEGFGSFFQGTGIYVV